MRIALLTDGIAPFVIGGMQRHSFHLAKNLLRLGVELTLVHAVGSDEEIPTDQEVEKLFDAAPGKLHVHGLNFPKAGRLPGHYVKESYNYSCQVYELLKDDLTKFDFIYAKGFTGWCLLEHRKKGEHMAPVGVKFHGYEMFQKARDLKSRIVQFMFRSPVVFINRQASVVFSYGGEITEIIQKIGVPEDQIVNIGSGIEDDWIASEPKSSEGVRKFLFIGRNERRKGIKDLLKCAGVIKKLPVEIHWIGPIPERYRMKIPNSIYHGEIKDSEKLRDIIDNCQILVAPSHAEGMPNVILEAMARGLAVISTNVGAVPMLVDDTNGTLIKPGNIKALRNGIKRMATISDDELHSLRMESIRKVDRDYRWSAIAGKTIAAIRKITFSK